MSAYVFFDIFEIIDQQKMDGYRRHVGQTVGQYGGRYLVIGGRVDILEGDWRPVLPVIIEFPSLEQAYQ